MSASNQQSNAPQTLFQLAKQNTATAAERATRIAELRGQLDGLEHALNKVRGTTPRAVATASYDPHVTYERCFNYLKRIPTARYDCDVLMEGNGQWVADAKAAVRLFWKHEHDALFPSAPPSNTLAAALAAAHQSETTPKANTTAIYKLFKQLATLEEALIDVTTYKSDELSTEQRQLSTRCSKYLKAIDQAYASDENVLKIKSAWVATATRAVAEFWRHERMHDASSPSAPPADALTDALARIALIVKLRGELDGLEKELLEVAKVRPQPVAVYGYNSLAQHDKCLEYLLVIKQARKSDHLLLTNDGKWLDEARADVELFWKHDDAATAVEKDPSPVFVVDLTLKDTQTKEADETLRQEDLDAESSRLETLQLEQLEADIISAITSAKKAKHTELFDPTKTVRDLNTVFYNTALSLNGANNLDDVAAHIERVNLQLEVYWEHDGIAQQAGDAMETCTPMRVMYRELSSLVVGVKQVMGFEHPPFKTRGFDTSKFVCQEYSAQAQKIMDGDIVDLEEADICVHRGEMSLESFWAPFVTIGAAKPSEEYVVLSAESLSLFEVAAADMMEALKKDYTPNDDVLKIFNKDRHRVFDMLLKVSHSLRCGYISGSSMHHYLSSAERRLTRFKQWGTPAQDVAVVVQTDDVETREPHLSDMDRKRMESCIASMARVVAVQPDPQAEYVSDHQACQWYKEHLEIVLKNGTAPKQGIDCLAETVLDIVSLYWEKMAQAKVTELVDQGCQTDAVEHVSQAVETMSVDEPTDTKKPSPVRTTEATQELTRWRRRDTTPLASSPDWGPSSPRYSPTTLGGWSSPSPTLHTAMQNSDGKRIRGAIAALKKSAAAKKRKAVPRQSRKRSSASPESPKKRRQPRRKVKQAAGNRSAMRLRGR